MHIEVREISTGKVIHRGWYRELADIWAPTSEVVGEWFSVPADDVNLTESDDGDVIEINGKVVASIEWTWRRAELRQIARETAQPVLQAAE